MAEQRNPVGYEKQKLYQFSNISHIRVESHAAMMKTVTGSPGFFVVDVDEVGGGQDTLYFWSGIEAVKQISIEAIDSAMPLVRKGRLAHLNVLGFLNRFSQNDSTSDGTATTETSRLSRVAIGNLSNIQFFYANARGLGAVAEVTSDDITIEASIEYPAGTLTRIYFSNSTTYLLRKNRSIISDPAYIEIPSGATFWVRTNVLVTAGQRWIKSQVSNAGSNEGAVTGTNSVMSGTITNSSSFTYGPMLALGASNTLKPVILFQGDSLSRGTNDTENSETTTGGYYPYRGIFGRAFGKEYPVIIANVAGQQLIDWDSVISPIYKDTISTAKYAISNLGINDISVGTKTLIEMKALYLKLWGTNFSRGVKTYQTTITPQTASTDAWATVENQTVHATNGVRIDVNNWIRDGAPITISTYIGAATGIAAGLDIMRIGHKLHPLTGYFETADTVESARDSGKFKAGVSSDGVHLNNPGYTLAYRSIILSVFV